MGIIIISAVFAVSGMYAALSEKYMTGLVLLITAMSVPLLNTL
jgi:hypothetical protein